jgi:quercetin dioxygenase-like cupin family protein
MPILDKSGSSMNEMYPGFKRWSVVDGEKGSTQLSVSEVLMEAGSTPPLHAHPTEETILIANGELEAYVGDETYTVTAGQFVLAPPGVKHGFANKSGKSALIYGIHPTPAVQTTWDPE